MRMTLNNLAIRASARLCEMAAIICLLAGVATAAYILKQPAHARANDLRTASGASGNIEMAGDLSSR